MRESRGWNHAATFLVTLALGLAGAFARGFVAAALALVVFDGTFDVEVFFVTGFLTVTGFVDVVDVFFDFTAALVVVFVAFAGAALVTFDVEAGFVFSFVAPSALPLGLSFTRPLGPLGSTNNPFSAPCEMAWLR